MKEEEQKLEASISEKMKQLESLNKQSSDIRSNSVNESTGSMFGFKPDLDNKETNLAV